MTITLETLAAVYRIAKELIFADGDITEDETLPLSTFLKKFPDLDSDALNLLMQAGAEMSEEKACSLIKELDDDSKQQMADLFAKIICADGDVTEEEKNLYFHIQDMCELPAPSFIQDDGDSDEENSEEEIIPAFIVANYYGVASLHQSEHEDWATLGDELAEWIGCDRVEVVRFTPALNALSKELSLNERHLVFMVARNGYGDRTVGDNMTATLLYGGGYPIYGNIVFALETDQGYEIEGIRTRSLVNEVFDAVNNAVDGLLRWE